MRPSELDHERWRQIDHILDAALDTPAAERDDFLDDICADDPELRAEVEALLEAAARAESRFEHGVSLVAISRETEMDGLEETRRVGPFRLLREIGRGGMGVVYLAEDTRLGRHVALKALPPYLGVGEQAKKRFLSEARAVSALDHPNIATLYEIDETEDGQLFMAFAFYRGETLEERIERGPLPIEEVIAIAVRIADGLAAAHDHGIVHRDIKPSNVLQTDEGEVKLLDFGVAKVAGEDVTREGVQLGTAAYMSPEQARGATVDHRTDLWSLGVVLYELLTGVRPFRGGEHDSPTQAILHEEPEPPSGHRPEVPEVLDRIVMKLLCKEPRHRYESAVNLAADLRTLQRGETPEVAISKPRTLESGSGARFWTRRRSVSVVILPILAALVGGVWLASDGAKTTNEPIERLAVLPLENRTGDPEQQDFVDGIHEAIIGEIGKLGAIDVLSRTSMARYRSTHKSVREIAGELDVDAVMEGSVLREGDSLTITTQLIATSPEHLLWSENYRRSLDEVSDVPGLVARSMAAEIDVLLSRQGSDRSATQDPVAAEAYDAYLRGSFHWERRNREGFELARNYFSRAIGIDSTFAPAYAGLSHTFSLAADWLLEEPSEVLPQARSLAEAALQIDGDLSEAYSAEAKVEFLQDWDWAESERLSRRALELNPSDVRALRTLASSLGRQGLSEEARATTERANALDPTPEIGSAMTAYMRRDYEVAIAHARASREFDEGLWQSGWIICLSLSASGAHSEAIAECERVVEQFDPNPVAMAALGYAYGLAGKRDEAERLLAELTELSEQVYVAPALRAMIYGAMGERDRAFAWLDRAYEERDPLLLKIRAPWFEPLEPDPRFEALLRKISGAGADR